MPKPATAFVLNLFDTGLAAARSLGRLGLPVVGVDHAPNHVGFASRYVRGVLAPDPTERPEALLALLLEEGRRLEQPGILFPASDAHVLFVSRHRAALSECFRMALPPADVLEAIIDKRRQYELAARVGTPLPATYHPRTLAEAEAIADRLEYPAIIKPCYGHLWRKHFSASSKGLKVRTPAELRAKLAEVLRAGQDVVVQSVILGPATHHVKLCAYLDASGDARGIFTLRKLRQFPVEFGVGCLVESCADDELVRVGLEFLQGIGYRGIGSVEFKRDERDGRLKLIELNPRLWQQNGLAAACGVNFPHLMYQELTGADPAPVTGFRQHVRWLDLEADIVAARQLVHERRVSPLRVAAQWLGAHTYAKFAWDDPLPALKARFKHVPGFALPRAPGSAVADARPVVSLP